MKLEKQFQIMISENFSMLKYLTGFDTLSIDCKIFSHKIVVDCSNTIEYYSVNGLQSYLVYCFFDTTTDFNKEYLKLHSRIEQISIKIQGNFKAYSAEFKMKTNALSCIFVITSSFISLSFT